MPGPSAAGVRWTVPSAFSPLAEAISHALPCPPPIAQLLVARGISTPAAARAFLRPDPSQLHAPHLLLGMHAAVQRIRTAILAAEPILIYGDYDVDGTTATVLLKTAIELAARTLTPGHVPAVTFHVPHRLREGYGIQASRLAAAAAEGVRLVISVDTGIRAFAAAEEARALALDLIVTDHHLPDGVRGIPDAAAVINPAQPGCPYPNKALCGAGVAFKLAHALLLSVASTPAQQQRLDAVLLPSFLKLVAIATIADSVPLTGENRAIAALGLQALANPVQPGLRALLHVAQLPQDRAPSAHEVGFRLAPRINAAGRMDVASDVVELFLTRDPDRATHLAEKLDNLNTERRATEAAALDAIDLKLETLRDPALTGPAQPFPARCIVLDDPAWHRGVLGILASRVVDRTGRPALVLASSDGEAHGSGRSVPGYHLLDALTHVHSIDSALFTRFGGHAYAVGFSLPSTLLPVLRQRLHAHSASLLTDELLQTTFACDLELPASVLTSDLAAWLARLAPFGMENPEPILLTRGLTLSGPPRIIKERHVCLPLTSPHPGTPLSAMGWSRMGQPGGAQPTWAERTSFLAAGSAVDLVYRLRHNQHPQWGGLELDLLDLAPAAAQ